MSCAGFRELRRFQGPNQSQVFFLLEQSARLGLESRRDDDFAENFADGFGERFVHRPIAYDHAPERRLLVGRERFLPGFAQIAIGPHPARIRVLQDRDGRFRKFRDQISGRADVENVVKREFLAMQFLEMLVEIAIERGGLMRIFAVTQAGNQRKRE